MESFYTLKTFNLFRSNAFWLILRLRFVKLWSAVILSLPPHKSEFCCHSFHMNILKPIAKVEILFSCMCNFFFARQSWLSSLCLIRAKFLLLQNISILLFSGFTSLMTHFVCPLQQISEKIRSVLLAFVFTYCIFLHSFQWCLYYYVTGACVDNSVFRIFLDKMNCVMDISPDLAPGISRTTVVNIVIWVVVWCCNNKSNWISTKISYTHMYGGTKSL